MKLLSLIVFFTLVMLVVTSPLPKKDNADDSKDLNAESKDDSKDSKGDSKDAKADSKDKSKDDSKSASATASGNSASVLKSQKYNDFQISDGVAGDAEEKALALFQDIDRNNLAAVSDEDLKIIKSVHDVAEDAEVEAFNPAIASASGPDAEALQIGKIKNKVLKLVATNLQLDIQMAQGNDVKEKLDKEKTKLAKNIDLDAKQSGNPSKSVPFDGST